MKRIIYLFTIIIFLGFTFIPKGYATITLKINGKLQAEVTNQVVCTGEDAFFGITMTVIPPVPAVSYSDPRWTGTGAAYINDVTLNSIVFNCGIPGDYSITFKAFQGATPYTITQTITVKNKDNLVLDLPNVSPLNVCEGSAVSFKASGASQYYWYRDDGSATYPDLVATGAIAAETPPAFGTWNYRLYGISLGGCTTDPASFDFTVVVEEAPTVNSGGPYQTCQGVGVALNGTIGGSASSAQWIGGLGTFVPNRNTLNATYTPHATESGTIVSLILRTDDPVGVCSYAESSASLTVHSLPTVTLSAFSPVCIDVAPFALSGGLPASGTYSGPGVSGGNFNPATAGAGTHTITYTYTDGNGCVNSATNTITVNALPVVTFGGVLTAQCLSSTTYALSGGNPAGGTYSGTGVTGTNFNATVAGVGNHTITYTYTNPATGCTNSATNTITVNALPVVSLGAFTDICVNAPTFALSGGNPVGGTYSGPGVSGGNFTPLTAGVGTHTITYTYTDVNGCSNSATSTIKVNDKPNVTLSAFASVCINVAPFALTGGSPIGGAYSGPGVSGGNFNPATAGAGTHTITYSYTDGFGCSNSATNTITVNALPVVTFGGTLTAQCISSTTYALTGGNPAGGTYSGTGVTGTNFNASVAGLGTHTITYSYTNPATGCSSSATNSITVNALPVVTFGGALTAQCLTSTNYALSGGNPIGGVYTGPGVTGTNFNASTAGAGTHTITYTYTNISGCTNSATNTITVYALPTVTFGGTLTSQCLTSTIYALTGGSPLGGTYSGTGVTGTNFNASVAGVGTHTITYSYTDGNGCSNSATNTITVNALPVVTFGGSLAQQCIASTTYALTGGNPAGGTYSGTGVTGTNFNASLAGVGTHTITYTYTNPATGCTNSATNTITVNALPVVTFGGVLASQCLSSTTYALTGGNPAGGIYSGTGVTGTNFNASVAGVGTYTITYTYTNPATGCSNSATNSITVYALPSVTFGGTLAAQCVSATTYALTGGNPVGGVYTGTGVTGTNFNASVAGVATHTLTYTYTDGNGCSNNATNTIIVNPLIGNNTISAAQAICYNSIPAQLTGTVPTGGSGTYTYKWQSSTVAVGGPFADIPLATSATYQPVALTVNTWYRRIVSSNVCSDNTSNVIAITVGPVFTVGFTSTAPLCVGASNGTITANPVGGTPGYSYSWNTVPVQLTKTATNLVAGTYTVTVTDNIGCIITGNATLADPTPVTLAAPTITNVTGCFGNTNGAIQIQAAGGTSPYTYSLYNNNVLVTSQTKATGIPANFTTLGASALYEVKVVDANNCGPVSSGILTITQPLQLTITSVDTLGITCNGYNDGTITINASGGTAPYQYSIDGSATLQASNTFAVGEGGYDIYVVDANLCEVTWPVQIQFTNPPKITFTYQVSQITTCNGDNSGKIELSNVAGGSGSGYQFSILNPAVWGNNMVFNNLFGGAANPYLVRVKDSKGCIETANNGNPIIINQPSAIVITLGPVTNVTGCWYNTNGSIRVTSAAGGTGIKTASLDQITWKNLPYTFTGLGVNNYTIYAKDANGCIVTKNQAITGPPPIVISTLTTKDVTCFGGTDGEIHAVATGGTGILSYSIDGATYSATGDFLVLAAGTITLSVKDGNNCIFTQPVTITQPPQLIFSSQVKTDITCNGLVDGKITLVASGGTPPYSYSITGGAPYSNLTGLYTGLAAGTYNVAVQDSKGCQAVGSALTIIDPPVVSITSATKIDITCFGAGDGKITVVAGGGTSPLTYTLLDGLSIPVVPSNTNTNGLFTGLKAGSYKVSVNDANSCGAISTAVLTIVEPTVLSLTFLKTDLKCHGDASGDILLTAAGGTPPYQYSIDGGTTYSINDFYTGLAGGIYNVSTKDANGCIQTTTVTLVDPPAIGLTLTGTDLSCSGVLPADGSVIAVASGGTLPYSYKIDGGALQASGTFNGLSAGLHTVDVVDNKGCNSSNTVTINSPTPITILTTNFTNPTCSTQGDITVTASGGTGALTYTLNPGGVTNATGHFVGVGTGVYTVSVTDTKSCGPTVSAPINIVSPSTISIDNVAVTNILGCFGNTTGSIVITASGGTAPLSYSIDGGTTTQASNTFSNLAAGNYNVVVNDITNCPQSQLHTITEPAKLIVSNIAITQVSAPAASDGSIIITASGGTGTLHYTLTPGAVNNTTGIFLGLTSGSYTVNIVDDNNCSINTVPILIGLLDLVITPTQITCNGANNGQIDLAINGGNTPYTIAWTGPSGALSAFDNMTTITGLAPGLYSATVVDNNGFTNTQSTTITEPIVLTASKLSQIDPLCFSASSGSVTFDIQGGTAPYTITWGANSSVGLVAIGVSSGTFDFDITDANGCSTAVTSITLVDPAKLNITKIDSVNLVCFGASTGSIAVTAAGGTGKLKYSVTGPTTILADTSNVLDTLLAGSYTVEVVDDNGCIAFSDVPLTVNITEPPVITITSSTPAVPLTCPNVPDGYVRLVIGGGTPDYTFLWSNGQLTQDLEGVVSGDYTVTITDAAGCTMNKTVTVAGPQMLTISGDVINTARCYEIKETGDDSGGVEILATSGGTGTNFTYLWSYISPTGPVTGSKLDKVSSGTYTVTITDEAGCKYDFEYFVPFDPAYYLNARIAKDTIICYGANMNLVAETNGPLTRTYTYAWYKIPETSGTSLNQNSEYTVTPLESTQYYLEIRNDGGCFSNDTVDIGVYPNIGLFVPQYISAVKDTIISILAGTSYNIDVNTLSTEYETTFAWEPSALFTPANTWNSSMLYNDDVKALIPAERQVVLFDPVTRRDGNFILVDVKAVTSVGCADSIRLYTKLVDRLYFGNVFSPNGDGLNDVWRVPKDYLFPDLNIEVFNRWGALVWSATGEKAAKGWNGKTNNGNELPIGTYYYVIKYNINTTDGKWKPITGSITIVR